MAATAISMQEALSFLDIETEAVIRAIDVLSANRIVYHPLSGLALRMQMTSSEAEEALRRYESSLVEAVEAHGERAYSFAPQDEKTRTCLEALLTAYRSERERLRETLSRQTEIQRLQDELEFSQDLMGTILSNVGEILIVDLNGAVMATSAFVEQTLGICKGDSRKLLEQQLTFDPLDGTEVRDIQIGDCYLECHISDFVSRGKLVGRNISIKDVTEERKLQQAREMYERSRKQLFSIVAHELQNPALGLQSFLQDTLDMIDRILVSGKLPEMEQDLLGLKEDVYLNQRGQTLLNRVIGDIFDYVKLQRGQMQFSIESDVSVDYMIALCSMQCEPLCKRKGISLVKPSDDAYEGLPELVGDSTRLVQVLNNLIKNAVKFTPAHGEIRLSVGVEETDPSGDPERRVYVDISDTGRGMTESEIDMIFKEYRGSKSDGMGLGLMISDLIIKAHGGQITIQSRIGKGSVFRVSLPVSSVPHAVHALPPV